MAGATAKREILDPILKELNLSSFDYANYSKRDTDLVTEAVKKTISMIEILRNVMYLLDKNLVNF